MDNAINILISLLGGGCIGGCITYFYMYIQYNIQEEKEKIRKFITQMESEEDPENIKQAVQKFSKTCCDFSPQSFRLLKNKEFDEIAKLIEVRNGLYFSSLNYVNNDIHHPNNPSSNATKNFSEEQKIEKKINEKFLQIIGVQLN